MQKKSTNKLRSVLNKRVPSRIEKGTILLQGDQSLMELNKPDLLSVSIVGCEKAEARIKSAIPRKS